MDSCEIYWQSSDWLPVVYILERWCTQQNQSCFDAKLQALLSACDRGDLHYRRRDGKTFDDPVDELWRRNLLLIERASFETWVMALEGKNPLTSKPTPPSHASVVSVYGRPSWVDEPWPFPPNPSPSPSPSTAAPLSHRTPVATTGVDSDAIIAGFRVKEDEAINQRWWKSHMRDATRYQLNTCRVQIGGPNRGDQRQPSLWKPDAVAGWLVDKGHLSSKQVVRMLRQHFPESSDAADWL